MPYFKIEELPVELVQTILTYLDWKSVSAFSLANKQYHSIASNQLFRTISLGFKDTQSIEQEVDKWNDILTKYSSHSQVHSLIIKGRKINAHRDRPQGDWNEALIRSRLSEERNTDVGILRIFSSEHSISGVRYEPTVDMANDTAWLPLAQFICRLDTLALVNITWASGVPPCILRSLQPRCRLEALRLSYSEKGQLVIDPNPGLSNLAPLLTSFTLNFGGGDILNTTAHVKKLKDLDLILQTAIFLEKISIWWRFPSRLFNTDAQDISLDQSDLIALPFEDDNRRTISPMGIHQLHLRIDQGVSTPCLSYWARRIDFARLKVLKLEGPITSEALRWATSNYTFPALEALSIYNWWMWDWQSDSMMAAYYEQLVQFLQRLRPLTRLMMCGSFTPQIISTIFNRHGSSLRELRLENNHPGYGDILYLDTASMYSLCEKCTDLEILKVPMLRPQSKAEETSIYHKLGRIKTLRRLCLSLKIPSRQFQKLNRPNLKELNRFEFRLSRDENDPALREQLYPEFYSYVRTILDTFVVDLKRIQEIFEGVSGRNQRTTCVLESLRLDISMPIHSDFGRSTVGPVLETLSGMEQKWMLLRDNRDTHRNVVYVQSITKTDFVSYNNISALSEQTELCRCIMEVLEETWPEGSPKPTGCYVMRTGPRDFPCVSAENLTGSEGTNLRFQPIEYER